MNIFNFLKRKKVEGEDNKESYIIDKIVEINSILGVITNDEKGVEFNGFKFTNTFCFGGGLHCLEIYTVAYSSIEVFCINNGTFIIDSMVNEDAELKEKFFNLIDNTYKLALKNKKKMLDK